MSTAGLQSSLNVQSQPVIPSTSALSSASTWAWIWFILAMLTIIGFHVRVFGHPVPPAARFP
jgi:hypothetical protein